jgi:hypothetical protein
MKTYQYVVTLKVEVEAFDEGDAWDAVQDAFGTGESMGVSVTECTYKETHAKR